MIHLLFTVSIYTRRYSAPVDLTRESIRSVCLLSLLSPLNALRHHGPTTMSRWRRIDPVDCQVSYQVKHISQWKCDSHSKDLLTSPCAWAVSDIERSGFSRICIGWRAKSCFHICFDIGFLRKTTVSLISVFLFRRKLYGFISSDVHLTLSFIVYRRIFHVDCQCERETLRFRS